MFELRAAQAPPSPGNVFKVKLAMLQRRKVGENLVVGVTKMNEVPGITGSRNNTILEFMYVSVNLEKKKSRKEGEK